jgi:hypothetical protein
MTRKRLSQLLTVTTFLTLGLFAAATVTPAVAQTKSKSRTSKSTAKKPSAKSSSSKPAPKKVETPFDVATKKLPVPFVGNTVEWVRTKMSTAPKGEFETTAEYEARLSTAQSETYAFVPEDPYFKYDADTETVSLTIYPSTTRVGSKPAHYFKPINIHSKKLSESEYLGTNAFGASVTVTKTSSKQTQIVTYETPSVLSAQHDAIKLSLKMPRDRARTASPILRLR